MTKKITTILLILIFLTTTTNAINEHKSFYGITWRGEACDNLRYAQSTGYTYIIYQNGMENCPEAYNIKFYLIDQRYPNLAFDPRIDLNQPPISQSQINYFYQNMAKKNNNNSFPENMASGWWDTSTRFKTMMDIQQQRVIDLIINDTINKIKNIEKPLQNFTFAGYAYDVPQLTGDYWNAQQNNGGQQINLSYWTGQDTAIPSNNTNYEYNTYSEASKEFYKQQISKTRQAGYPEVRFIIEPYDIYNEWLKDTNHLVDYEQIRPDLLCQERTNTNYLTDNKITNKHTLNELCITTTKTTNYATNLQKTAEATTAGAYFNWFGVYNGDQPIYPNIDYVPADQKILRLINKYDNDATATNRSWNATTKVYKSSNSYADLTIAYTKKTNTNQVYVHVNNNQNTGIPTPTYNYQVYNTNGFLEETTITFNYTISDNTIILPTGYYKITQINTTQPEITPDPQPQPEPQLQQPQQQIQQEYTPQYQTTDAKFILIDFILNIFKGIGNVMPKAQ